MRGRRTTYFRLAVASGAAALLFVTVSVAAATPTSVRRCAQFEALKKVFPKATAVGFTSRTAVRREAPREPVWPGRCAAWSAEYRAQLAYADTSLTLYRTHKQALVALAEPAYGPVKRLANGALVRTDDSPAWVNGVQKRAVGVVSVYRNVFISSLSIAKQPISLPSQLRFHRRMHAGVAAITR